MTNKEPIFDWELMSKRDKRRASNTVWYVTHAGDTPVYEDPTDNHKACYSGLLSVLRADTKKNFVSTRMEFLPTEVDLTKEDCLNWIDLCQVYGLLPWYVKPEDCIHPHTKKQENAFWGKLTLFTKDVPQSKMYMYLDNFRKLREERGFVKAMLYLVLEKGMDFYVAYTLVSHFHITNIGHHTTQIQIGVYCRINTPVPSNMEGSMNLMMARNLFRFIFDTKLNVGGLIPNVTEWRCNKLITEVSKVNLVVPVKSLLEPEISKIVRELDDKKASKLCKEFNKNFK